MTYNATVIADTIGPAGDRMITVEATYWRAIHPQMLHHRTFSRGASSNRAMPVLAVLERTQQNPTMPVFWGKKRKGMQATDELSAEQIEVCKRLWLGALDSMASYVRELDNIGLHKQVTNRLIEPWQDITAIYSGTDWSNFFKLRCHKDAQPEEQLIARLIREAIEDSTPVERDWHLPYVTNAEMNTRTLRDLIRFSVARCARVSYLNHDGLYAPDDDIVLYDRLLASDPPHSGPLEHVALADAVGGFKFYNLTGFMSWRYLIEQSCAEYMDLDGTLTPAA